MNSARTNLGRQHHGIASIALALAAASIVACGLEVDSLFTSGGVGGSGGAGVGGAATTTSTHSSSHASTSSGTHGSTSSTTSTSTSASSSGALCGDGVCTPPETSASCPDDCPHASSSSSSTSTSSGGGTCAHPVCDTGAALTASCSPCAAAVCAQDDYCCNMAWDGQCVDAADAMCGSCCGDGTCNNTEDCKSCASDCGVCPPDPECPHSACFVGEALSTQACRDACVDQVCAQKPACCGNASWDGSCGLLAVQLCDADPCIAAVCAAMPSCCASSWTQACVDKAKMVCQTQCDCAHSICQEGGPLEATCNPCAKAVCKADAYCCTNGWDGICVGEAGSICGIVCQ